MLPASDVHAACVRVKRALRRAKFPLNERGTRIDADLRNGAGEFFVAALRHVLCSRSSVSRDIGDRVHDLLGIENDFAIHRASVSSDDRRVRVQAESQRVAVRVCERIRRGEDDDAIGCAGAR